MKKGCLVVLIGVLAQAVPIGQSAPAVAAPEGRRTAIKMMEALLSRAVLGGAEQLAEQLGGGNPNMSFFTGQARARGFLLEGFGVFFHVEVPEMLQGLVMSVATMERDQALASTFESLRRVWPSVPDGAGKLQAEQLIKRLEVQVGPSQQMSQQVGQGQLSASTIRPASNDVVAPLPPPPPTAVVRDPRATYREAIKSALIEAMLDYSRGMNIQPDEWLAVAVNRGDTPMPDEIVTSSTVVIRIKGSDLAVYEADRTQKDEIRKRVEVREF